MKAPHHLLIGSHFGWNTLIYLDSALFIPLFRNSTGSFLTSTPKKIQCLTNHQSGSKKPTIDDLSNKRTCKRNILDKTPSIIDLESGRKLNKRIKRPESYTVELDESVCSDHVPTE